MQLIQQKTTHNNRTIISVLKRRKGRSTPEKISVIKNDYKLIYNHPYSDELLKYFNNYPPPKYIEYELYNLKIDFSEKINLANNKKNIKTFQDLKKTIRRIRKLIINKNNSDSPKIKISKKEMEYLKSIGYI